MSHGQDGFGLLDTRGTTAQDPVTVEHGPGAVALRRTLMGQRFPISLDQNLVGLRQVSVKFSGTAVENAF